MSDYFAALLSRDDINIPKATTDDTDVNMVINIVAALGASVAVIIIIIAGLRMVTSAGNPDAVGNARKTIIYALAGLVVVLAARLIIGIVLGRIV